MKKEFATLQEQLRREYFRRRGIPTEQMELLMSDKKKGPLDRFFDAADDFLGGAEAALKPSQPDKPEVIPDAEFTDVPDRHKEWEAAWREGPEWRAVTVAVATLHVFRPRELLPTVESPEALCTSTFKHEEVGKVPLEHGKRMVACTTCILAVTRG